MVIPAQNIPMKSSWGGFRPHTNQRGFSMLETMVAMGILASVGLLVGMSFSFSILSQKEARTELEAARSAGQILEILRCTSFDALPLVEEGKLNMEPLGKFQQAVLLDIQDRLARENLDVFLTIRSFQGRTESKILHLVIATKDLSPHTSLEEVPKGNILVKQSTVVTKKGINP